MALIFFDSCGDNLGTGTGNLPGPWQATNNASVVAGGQNGNGIQIAPVGTFGYLTIPGVNLNNNALSGGSVGFGLGVAVYVAAIGGATIIPIAQLGSGATYWTFALRQVASVWYLQFNDNSGGSISVPYTPASATWMYFEAMVSTLQANNVVTLRVGGTPLVTGTMTSTIPDNPFVNAYVAGPSYSNLGVVATIYDNFYCFSTTGGTVQNLLGPQVVSVVLPNAAGRVTQFTPLSGANYTNVNIVPPPGDTHYNFSNVVGNTDAYALAALPGGLGVINGVQATVTARNTVSGRTLSLGIGNGTTESYGQTLAPGTSYVTGNNTFDTNPFTGVPFVAGDFTTLQLAVQVAS